MHNNTTSRKLNWATPNSVTQGYTPDISAFQFHVWEPIWYFEPKGAKSPSTKWKRGRWLGFARMTGDAMTYYIRTEKDKGQDEILV